MNKQLCFKIEQQNLFLEKTLVLFNDIPLFFICQNECNQRFLILCTDLEQLEYLVVSTTLSNLRNMLLQKCTMRNAILKGEKFWQVVSGETIEDDSYKAIEKDKIDLSILPKENAFYKRIFPEDEIYIEKIEDEYREETKNQYLEGLSFETTGTEIKVLVNSVDFLTENVNSVVESISETVSAVVGYFDVGPSIDSSINGIKRIFSSTEIEAERSKKLAYNCYYKKTKSSIVIKSDTILNGDETTNLAA